MKGIDLVNYIKEHHLEDAEIDTGISDPLQFVVTLLADKVSGERELVYDFTRDFVYEKYLSAEEITYEEAANRRMMRTMNDDAWATWQKKLMDKFCAEQETILKKKKMEEKKDGEV